MKTLKHILKDAGFTEEQKQALIDSCDLMKEYLIDFKITQLLNEVETRFRKELHKSLSGVHKLLITILLAFVLQLIGKFLW